MLRFSCSRLRSSYLSYSAAQLIVSGVGCATQHEYYSWRRHGPGTAYAKSIPARPDQVYRERGWTDWYTWLGVAKPEKRRLDPAKLSKTRKFQQVLVDREVWADTLLAKLKEANPDFEFERAPWNSPATTLLRIRSGDGDERNDGEVADSERKRFIPLVVRVSDWRTKSGKRSLSFTVRRVVPGFGYIFGSKDSSVYHVLDASQANSIVSEGQYVRFGEAEAAPSSAANTTEIAAKVRAFWDTMERWSLAECWELGSYRRGPDLEIKIRTRVMDRIQQTCGLAVQIACANGNYNAMVEGRTVRHRSCSKNSHGYGYRFDMGISAGQNTCFSQQLIHASDFVIGTVHEEGDVVGIFLFPRSCLLDVYGSDAGPGKTTVTVHPPFSECRYRNAKRRQAAQAPYYIDFADPDFGAKFLEIFYRDRQEVGSVVNIDRRASESSGEL